MFIWCCEVVYAFPCGKFDNDNHYHNNIMPSLVQHWPKTSLVIMDVDT